jgi:hypothetical protein
MIDPIPVNEAIARINKEQEALQRRGVAALALAWFSSYALSKTGGGPRVTLSDVLPDEIKPVASATVNVEKAIPYLTRAFREHHRPIIERAIKLAQDDFKPSAPE